MELIQRIVAPAVAGTLPGVQVLRSVAAEAAAGSVRITFVFDPLQGSIGAGISYGVTAAEPPLRLGASGEPVTVAGEHFLHIEFRHALGYQGPLDLRPGTAVVPEILQLDDFEGYLVWVVGIAGQCRWAVTEMADPASLVIDVIPSVRLLPLGM